MKSNKWKFLLTGAATLTLLTACTQASSQSATKSNTAQTTTTSTSKNKTNNSNYFTDKDKDSSYDESKASTVKTVWIFCKCIRWRRSCIWINCDHLKGWNLCHLWWIRWGSNQGRSRWLRWCSHRLERRYHDQHQRANFCYESRACHTWL